MDPSCLEYCLTETERQHFQDQGYLVVEDALPEAMLGRVLEVADRVDARERTPEHGADKLLSVSDVIGEDDTLVELIDWPRTFPKVWGILGWNIYLYHSHLDITPRVAPGTEPDWQVAWHQDSMRVNDELEYHPRPRLSLKIGFFLTDVTRPNSGNTLIVPGSHLLDEIDCPHDGQTNPPGAEPLCVRPGTAVLIDRRIWHSRSPNLSGPTRKVLWFGYAYRWLRPKDQMTVEHLHERLDPVQRQILGDGQSANGTYDPVEADVPLRGWLAEHCPAAAAWTQHPRPQAQPPAIGRGHNTGRR